jgi:hypothetical protein
LVLHPSVSVGESITSRVSYEREKTSGRREHAQGVSIIRRFQAAIIEPAQIKVDKKKKVTDCGCQLVITWIL